MRPAMLLCCGLLGIVISCVMPVLRNPQGVLVCEVAADAGAKGFYASPLFQFSTRVMRLFELLGHTRLRAQVGDVDFA
jgi:hypothetical protein